MTKSTPRHAHEKRGSDDEEQCRDRRPERLGREAVADRQVFRDPGDPRDEGRPGDRLAVSPLREHERHVGEQHGGRHERGDDGSPSRPQPDEQPGCLRGDEEDREVVRRDREPRHHRPCGERPAAPAQREPEREHGPGTGEHEDRVGAGLLRVPDEERAGGDERGGDEARAARHEHGTGAVGDRDGGGAGERGERAKPDLAEAEDRSPRPREDVVEERGRLAARNLAQHVPEAPVEQGGRHELVEPEALAVERREAKDRAEQGEGRDGQQRPRDAHQAVVERPPPRSPASAPSAVTMNSG
jgi:hypothetical protein